MEYLRLAVLQKPFGLEGIIRAHSLTSFPDDRFVVGNVFFLYSENKNERTEHTLTSFRKNGDDLFLGFSDIKNPEDALLFRGLFVEMDKSKAPLPAGYIRLEDLKGCQVKDEKGTKLGVVKDILQYTSTITLLVKRDEGKDFMVPFVQKEFIVDYDLEKKSITIHVIPGLL